MKRFWICCFVGCLLSLSACRPAKPGMQTAGISGTALLPLSVKTMTVAYSPADGEPNGEKTTYTATSQQFKSLYRLLADSRFVPLDDDDALAFSSISSPENAALLLTFDTGKSLAMYEEGALCRFDGAATARYAASPDTLYRLEKLLNPGFEAGYVSSSVQEPSAKPAAIHPERAGEIAMYLPPTRSVFPFGDGFLTFQLLKNGMTRTVCTDGQGRKQWVREYDTFQDAASLKLTFLALKDGGFAVAAENNGVLRCDRDGEPLWSNAMKQADGIELPFLFETENGAILGVGRSSQDFLIVNFHPDGNSLKMHTSDLESSGTLLGAVYTPESGLVVLCDSLCPYLRAFDDNLTDFWQTVFTEWEGCHSFQIAAAGSGMVVACALPTSKTAVYRLDTRGNRMAQSVLDTSAPASLTASADGSVRLAFNQESTAQIYELDHALRTRRVVDDAQGTAGDCRMTGTDDGGFFTLRQTVVKSLPQPPWLNRGMSDTAAVLSRYDRSGALVYRKVYDRSSCTEAEDVVIPLPDGRVLVGK